MTGSYIHRTIPEQIAERLRTDILAGRLEPGQPLREQEIAERFGVSRGPVREAFRQLGQQGLLVTEPNKGVRVAQQLSAEVRPLVVELRRTIETAVLANIFDQISDEDIDNWSAILADIKAACQRGDKASLLDHDLRFHQAIVQSHDEREFFTLWQPITLRMLMQYGRFGDDLMASYAEHAAIFDAIRRGDKEAALKALAANIQ